MFEDEERCLNLHPLFWVPVGSVYGKASHVLFRVRSASVLDQGLIERGCDCSVLSRCTNVCSGMRVNSWPPQRTWSILAYIDYKLQEMHSTVISERGWSCAWTDRVIRIFSMHYSSALLYWVAVGRPQSSGCCLELVTAMCQDHGELCFIQSLIKVETLSGVLRHCSASKT